MLPRLSQSPSRALVTAGVAVVIGLLSGWLLSPASRVGTSLVRSSYDWSQELLPETSLSNSPVVIVYLDLDSYRLEKQNPVEPWSRALHARLLNRLTAAGAKAVVFDIIFDEANTNSAVDQEFAGALRANGKTVIAGEINFSSRNTSRSEGIKSLESSMPAALFLNAAAGWGMASLKADNDFVVRRYFPGFSPDEPSLTAATARLAGVSAENISGAQWIRYYGPPLVIPHVSYSSALRSNEIGDDFFRGKIIFIGARPMAGTFLERKDQFRSPLANWSDNELFMPAVEVQATQMLNLVRGDSFHRLSPRNEILTLLGTALLFSWLLFRFRPLPAAGVALIAEVAVFAAVARAVASGPTWFPWFIIAAVQIPAALAGSVLWQSLQWYQQRKKFEAQRRADEAKIHEQAALIEKAQDAILVQGMQGGVVYANPSAERLYGWSAGELAHSNAIPIPDRVRQAALAAGEWLGELDQKTRDGRKITVASRCTLIKDNAGQPKSLMFINTDVTEKKRLEQEFFRAQRAESVGSLASGMAHDLNNAFAPILMGLQLLQQQRQDAETQRMLSVMEQNTHRGADMVRQVLLFCRGSDSQRQPILLGRLLREMEQMVRQTFPRSINVAALAPADLWPVLGNATQLHQILLNLCVNARDAMPKGGELTLAADNVEFTADEAAGIPQGRAGRYVMLLVSDTGSGIPPELLPRIFEPFFTTKPADRGTGLGLSTVARIVAQHEGFLNVKSEVNRGTTFEIYLPRATVAPLAEMDPTPIAGFKRGHGELILVADDEQAVLEMVSFTLGEQGYRVITATNGAEAIAKMESNAGSVRLALLDTDMPIMNGPQTISALHAHSPSLPVVLMSGEIEKDAQGPNVGTLAKPFQLHELLDAVAKGLNGH
jgi:two-component system, cell cycle sensor histidine kinase and response regulator CckA